MQAKHILPKNSPINNNQIPKITWSQQPSGQWVGRDNAGTVYRMPANQDTCQCKLLDGRVGYGWTPEQAYQDAMRGEK